MWPKINPPCLEEHRLHLLLDNLNPLLEEDKLASEVFQPNPLSGGNHNPLLERLHSQVLEALVLPLPLASQDPLSAKTLLDSQDLLSVPIVVEVMLPHEHE